MNHLVPWGGDEERLARAYAQAVPAPINGTYQDLGNPTHSSQRGNQPDMTRSIAIPDLNLAPDGTASRHTQATPSTASILQPRASVVTWKHGLFAHRMPRRFKPVSHIWLFLRGAIMWISWQARNDAAFKGVQWHIEKMCCKI